MFVSLLKKRDRERFFPDEHGLRYRSRCRSRGDRDKRRRMPFHGEQGAFDDRKSSEKRDKRVFDDADRLGNDRCSIAFSRTVREEREREMHARRARAKRRRRRERRERWWSTRKTLCRQE